MNISPIGMGMKTEFLMSETITCPTCGGAAHIGRMESTVGTFKLAAVTDEQKSEKIRQLKKAFKGFRDKLEKAEARIAALEQQLSNVVAS